MIVLFSFSLLQQVLKDPEIGPGAFLEAKKQCPGLLALISQTWKPGKFTLLVYRELTT